MSLVFKHGDIFTSNAKVLVNTVNCVGAMGKGIALVHREMYPEQYVDYREMCDKRKIRVGKVYLWDGEQYGYEHNVLWFPTKDHWRYPSKLSWIERGLNYFVQNYERLGIDSIAFPKLGCSNGGLDWNDVKPLMIEYLEDLPIHIEIWE